MQSACPARSATPAPPLALLPCLSSLASLVSSTAQPPLRIAYALWRRIATGCVRKRQNLSVARELFAYAVARTRRTRSSLYAGLADDPKRTYEQPQRPQQIDPTRPSTFCFGGAIRGIVDELLSAVARWEGAGTQAAGRLYS